MKCKGIFGWLSGKNSTPQKFVKNMKKYEGIYGKYYLFIEVVVYFLRRCRQRRKSVWSVSRVSQLGNLVWSVSWFIESQLGYLVGVSLLSQSGGSVSWVTQSSHLVQSVSQVSQLDQSARSFGQVSQLDQSVGSL